MDFLPTKNAVEKGCFGRLFAALAVVAMSMAIGRAEGLSPGDRLTVTFTAAPNTADSLYLFCNDPLTITGAPVFTTSLYDGAILLATYTAAPSNFNGVYTFSSRFFSSARGPGSSTYTTISFAPINAGRITGRLVTTVSGGSVSGFGLGDLILYDASSVPNGYRPLADLRRSATALQSGVVSTTAPSISSLSPDSVTAGGPALPLTIDGTGFVTGATALWNGVPVATTFVSALQLTASVPPAQLLSIG